MAQIPNHRTHNFTLKGQNKTAYKLFILRGGTVRQMYVVVKNRLWVTVG
ncbi:MAG: hypothetical protein WCJ03_12570 [Bacteroidales bacterium]